MKKFSYIFILMAGVLWGSMGIFVRKLNSLGLVSMEIVALRSGVTMAAMFLFLLLFDRKLLKIHLKDIWCFFGTGICSIVFFNYCYFKAITLTSLSVAAVLLYTAPAMVMVFSYFLFGEKFTKRKLVSFAMTFTGCVLVTGVLTDGGRISVPGLLTGLSAGLGYALYSVFSRYALKKGYHSLTITFYTFLIASAATCFMADIRKVAEVMVSGRTIFLFCLALGILCAVVPYLIYTLGLQYVENSKASIIASVEPVTATLLGIMVFHESLTVTGMSGMVLVLGGILISS